MRGEKIGRRFTRKRSSGGDTSLSSRFESRQGRKDVAGVVATRKAAEIKEVKKKCSNRVGSKERGDQLVSKPGLHDRKNKRGSLVRKVRPVAGEGTSLESALRP